MRKIKVLFDASVLRDYLSSSSSRSGIFFTAYNIALELSKNENIELYFYSEGQFVSKIQKFLKDKQEEFQNVKIFLGDLKIIDIFFSPFHEIPQKIKESGIICYTFIHDLIPILFPDKHIDSNPDSWFWYFLMSQTYDEYYFTNSQNTKNDVIKYCSKVDAKKIEVVLLAAGDNFHPDFDKEKNIALRKKYNIPIGKRYIFSLCTLEPRKNLIFSIHNFIAFIKKNKIEDLVFVLGGGHWDIFFNQLKKEVKNLHEYKDKIIRAGYIADEDLSSLYSNAECSVYMSIYEGFGLPPLEAMKCGCPVITSNCSSIPEVVGNAAILVNPYNDEEMIKAYEKIYFDDELKQRLSKAGIQQAEKFSWKKCVDAMVRCFESHDFSKIQRKSFIIEYPRQKISKRVIKLIGKIINKILRPFHIKVVRIKK